jgi:hypothetical protein
VQVEQAPHLLAQPAATSDLLLAAHRVLEQLAHLQQEERSSPSQLSRQVQSKGQQRENATGWLALRMQSAGA